MPCGQHYQARALPSQDEKLLSRFLESGSIGVAIDGLNEVNRGLAVTAFTQKFAAAPMLVTSQQPGDQRYFATWRLPVDIRAFTHLALFVTALPFVATSLDLFELSDFGAAATIRPV
jgi:hypothetical protein